MRELYVYYRVREADAPAARLAVETLQAGLRTAHAGLEARLLRRPDASAGVQTWMEVYRRPTHPGGIDAALQAEVEARAAAHAARVDGPRHVEVFVALDDD